MTELRKNAVVGGDLAATLPDDPRPWYKVPHLLKLNAIILSLLMYSGTIGYDGSVMNGLQALPQWQTFVNFPVGGWLGFINAAQTIGGIVALPAQAYCADRFGRKFCLYVGVLFVMLGAGLQTGCDSTGTFIAGRFFIGLASTWFQTAAVLITEIAYPSHRAKVTAMFNCQFFIGAFIAAWVTFGSHSMASSWAWRIPSLFQLGVPLLALPGTLATPESPRWLVSKGRHEQARSILAKYHAGGEHTPLVAFEMAEIEKAIWLQREAATQASYADMFKTKGNRHRLFITVTLGFFAQWVGNGVVAYYLALILETAGVTSVTDQTLINGFLTLWALIVAVSAASLVDRLGRRKLFFVSLSIMLVSYILVTALSATFAKTHKAAVGTAVIPFFFIFIGGYAIAFTPMLVAYPAEIWTFELRARGIAVLWVTSYLASLFNIFVNPIALGSIGWKYYIVYVAIIVACFVTVYFTYPETRGHSLEEMKVIFDGEEGAVVPTEADIRREEEQVFEGVREKALQSGEHLEMVRVGEKV